MTSTLTNTDRAALLSRIAELENALTELLGVGGDYPDPACAVKGREMYCNECWSQHSMWHWGEYDAEAHCENPDCPRFKARAVLATKPDTLTEHLRRAGSVTSEVKRESSRANGAKGGRPRKQSVAP